VGDLTPLWRRFFLKIGSEIDFWPFRLERDEKVVVMRNEDLYTGKIGQAASPGPECRPGNQKFPGIRRLFPFSEGTAFATAGTGSDQNSL